MTDFDPSNVGINNGNFFGFPYSVEESDVVIFSVPWDVTVSFRAGTHLAPKAILAASTQLDFFDFDIDKAWETKIATDAYSVELEQYNNDVRTFSERIIHALESGESIENLQQDISIVNKACNSLNKLVFRKTKTLLEQNKLVGLVGGDHSSPLGFLQALAEKYDDFGILHIDAHADLRDGYEGFDFSHASIMYHALKLNSVKKLVQVAIRDVSYPEIALAKSDVRVVQFPDNQLKMNYFEGRTWQEQCSEIIANLPEKVYISMDIDGLSPENCPSTGTPVPGGLNFQQVIYLIQQVRNSGRKIIGFDLCECGEDEYDAIIGAHLLFKLALNMSATR